MSVSDLPRENPGLWRRLQSLAQAEVKATLAELPPKLRQVACAVPVIFEPVPDAETVAEGTEPDTLGLFIGPEMADSETSPEPLPPHIVLYLENIWDFAEDNEEFFCEEVHVTLLHELGHYLGLDELDLEERGLE